MERIKDRNKRRAALGDRKSAAAQNRMKNIASLADDQPAAKKRKKTANGRHDIASFLLRQLKGLITV